MRCLLAIELLASCVACSGGCSEPTAQSDAGDAAIRDVVVVDNFVPPVPEASSCTPPARPSYVPSSWVRYDDYKPCSSLYVPVDMSQMPDPIVWVDCASGSMAPGCRRIEFNWSPLPNGAQGTDADVAVTETGNPIIITSRSYGDSAGKYDHTLNIVADADGPVHAAVLATKPNSLLPYVTIAPSFSPPRWVLKVIENGSFVGDGYIGGTIDSPMPTNHLRFTTGDHAFLAGDLGILDIASNGFAGLLDFDSGAHLLDIQAALPMSFEWMFRSSVFWQGNTGRICDVGRWTADAGSIDFINYNLDPDHPAADLGTNGVDMVWLEAHGPATDASDNTTADYWTSPYVTDPANLQPRRLRSETPNALLGTPIAVGCGYAAFSPADSGLRIIRLSDGWSWFLSNVPGNTWPNGPGWDWQQALAITCTEVFARVLFAGPTVTVARVPLAQLGAGVPPD